MAALVVPIVPKNLLNFDLEKFTSVVFCFEILNIIFNEILYLVKFYIYDFYLFMISVLPLANAKEEICLLVRLFEASVVIGFKLVSCIPNS